MEEQLGKVVLLGVFGLGAYWDWKEQQICLYVPILAGIAGIILHLFFQEYTWIELLCGMAIGVIVLFAAWFGGESIGIGDGMMLVASGTFLGFWGNLELFMIALFISGITALFLIVVKRKGRKDRLPFIPFLLAAYLFLL